MAKIQWSVISKNDLFDIEDFIAKESVLYAQVFVDKIVDNVQHLSSYPKLGHKVPEIQHENIRQIICGKYRIIYWYENDIVTILRIIHSARDFGGIELF